MFAGKIVDFFSYAEVPQALSELMLARASFSELFISDLLFGGDWNTHTFLAANGLFDVVLSVGRSPELSSSSPSSTASSSSLSLCCARKEAP